MLTKSEKLAQRIQETQEFISDKTSQDATFAAISQELKKISNTLSKGKLVVQILSNNSVAAQALHNFLGNYKTLQDFYQFCIDTLPNQPEQNTPMSNELQQLANCDVLCIVVDLKQMSENEQWVIKQASNTYAVKKIVVVEVPNNSYLDRMTQANISEVEAWMQSYNFEPSIEIFPVFLSPFYPNAQLLTIEPNLEDSLDKLGKTLETLVKRRPEDILIKRITTQTLFQIGQIERIFDMDAELLKQQIRQAEEKLSSLRQSDSTEGLKEQAEQALKQVNEDKEKFFRQVKLEFNQSKAELLDGFNRKSILYKIQSFTDNLQPSVVRRGSAKYVQLQADNAQNSADINIDMMHLCYSNLSFWTIAQWEQIYTSYGEGGLSYFFQKTYTTLNLIPSFKFRASLFQTNCDRTCFQKSLKDLVAGVRCESYYKKVSVGSYLIRQVRNQWMGVMFLLTFITMTGLSSSNRRDFMKDIFKPLYGFKNQPILLTLGLAIPLCFLFLLLFYNYSQDSQQKLEDEARKLKKELQNYYQSFAKISVEKLSQDLISALEAEEERLRRIIDSFREHLIAHLSELKTDRVFIKSDLENLLVQQKGLDKARADLQKLKRI
ncbi:hypothetical protein UH38_09610 [Aliterella atlantica CENA595]|uniref:Uncharacterized protein n=1 Tax=Aliterella atlantica CENA595 TaxID=1618023 RepID=A0A0D8ZU21_9CYAN|nr:hypothetical protein UH38_09610 [Aliterella atlantica CENA595]